MVTFIGTISGTVEATGGYRQIPLRVHEYDQGKREFNIIAYYPSDSARFVEIGRSLQLSSNLYLSGELLIREKQRSCHNYNSSTTYNDANIDHFNPVAYVSIHDMSFTPKSVNKISVDEKVLPWSSTPAISPPPSLPPIPFSSSSSISTSTTSPSLVPSLDISTSTLQNTSQLTNLQTNKDSDDESEEELLQRKRPKSRQTSSKESVNGNPNGRGGRSTGQRRGKKRVVDLAISAIHDQTQD